MSAGRQLLVTLVVALVFGALPTTAFLDTSSQSNFRPGLRIQASALTMPDSVAASPVVVELQAPPLTPAPSGAATALVALGASPTSAPTATATATEAETEMVPLTPIAVEWNPTALPTPTEPPTPEPTIAPTATQEPTPEPTIVPTVEPTIAPTLEPTVPPTATPLPPVTLDGTSRVLKVPILMYHYISDPPADADRIRRDLSVSPANLRAQLTWLRDNGYTTISLAEVGSALAHGAPLPEKPVVLTFDDGYADNYANAFPLLRELGMRGTFFIVTDLVEEGHPAYMNWAQIAEMQQAGMEIGSHTRDHPQLPGKPAAYIVSQVQGSAEMLAARLGQRPIVFSYPGGRFDDGVIHLVHEAGYRVAVVTTQGTTHTTGNLMTLKRVRVRGRYSAEDLARSLGYWANRD